MFKLCFFWFSSKHIQNRVIYQNIIEKMYVHEILVYLPPQLYECGFESTKVIKL